MLKPIEKVRPFEGIKTIQGFRKRNEITTTVALSQLVMKWIKTRGEDILC